ncbi:unnamed protein product [Caenorhabditis brenneri]
MNREKYTDYLHRKIEHLEKTLFQVQDKYANFQQIVDKTRENEEKDVETCRKWILEQEQKDGKLHRELETLKAQIESLKRRSYEKSIDDQEGLIQKVEELGESVEELKRTSVNHSNSFISKTREHEGEMKVISEWIIKEEAKDWEFKNTIDLVKLAIQNLKEEIDSGKVDQQLVLKSANIELKSIRGDFEESKKVQNGLFQRLCDLNSRIDETEFYAKQMCREVVEQKFIIQSLAQENRLLREENARFQKQISEAFRALREEIRGTDYTEFKTFLELKKAKIEDRAAEQQKSPAPISPPPTFLELKKATLEDHTTEQQKSPAPISPPSTNFGEFCQPNPSPSSVEIAEASSPLPAPAKPVFQLSSSLKIVQEVLATWKQEDVEKKEADPQKDIVSTVTISMTPCQELPIQEAIIGEWKLVSSRVGVHGGTINENLRKENIYR